MAHLEQGEADSGRDINARFGVSNPVTVFYEEKWYVECKHYTRKVSKQVGRKIRTGQS